MDESSSFNSSSFFRKAIFIALLIGVFSFYHLFTFKGLTSSTGIDQAQVAREVARGNGLTTQFIRPVSIQQHIENNKEVNLEHLPDTYHSPLNILVYAGVIKLVGADDFDNYKMEANDKFYAVDKVLSITCAIFFLMAIGINYLLIARIFDTKIASVVAVVMMLSDFMWKLSQTGLPQMLMLTLFSTAMYLAWRAVEAQEADKKPLIPALLSGFFFGLLALTHWLTLWIFIGYFLFSIFYFKPRGVVALGQVGILILFLIAPVLYYNAQSGDPLGTAFHAIHGNAETSSSSAVKSLENKGLDVKGLLSRIGQTTLIQASNLSQYLGGLILAPAFFIALAHPFKRSSISIFRWNIVIMWIFASMGMALYGINDEVSHPNQMHILFAPLMAGYGIAMLSIIWARCPISHNGGLIGNLHICFVILVASAPLLLQIKSVTGPQNRGASVNGIYASSLNVGLHSITDERDIIFSDQPWAVAWYADRHAILTPSTINELETIEQIAEKSNPIQGLHFTSTSYRGDDIRKTWIKNRELTPLTYATWLGWFTDPTTGQANFSRNPEIAALVGPVEGRYKYIAPLSSLLEPSIYYSRDTISKRDQD